MYMMYANIFTSLTMKLRMCKQFTTQEKVYFKVILLINFTCDISVFQKNKRCEIDIIEVCLYFITGININFVHWPFVVRHISIAQYFYLVRFNFLIINYVSRWYSSQICFSLGSICTESAWLFGTHRFIRNWSNDCL
jgi:hypothetical protein